MKPLYLSNEEFGDNNGKIIELRNVCIVRDSKDESIKLTMNVCFDSVPIVQSILCLSDQGYNSVNNEEGCDFEIVIRGDERAEALIKTLASKTVIASTAATNSSLPSVYRKTRICVAWHRAMMLEKAGESIEAGKIKCYRGEKCNYAHGPEELKENPLFKTRVCFNHLWTGDCKYGTADNDNDQLQDGCHFAHSIQELRCYKCD